MCALSATAVAGRKWRSKVGAAIGIVVVTVVTIVARAVASVVELRGEAAPASGRLEEFTRATYSELYSRLEDHLLPEIATLPLCDQK